MYHKSQICLYVVRPWSHPLVTVYIGSRVDWNTYQNFVRGPHWDRRIFRSIQVVIIITINSQPVKMLWIWLPHSHNSYWILTSIDNHNSERFQNGNTITSTFCQKSPMISSTQHNLYCNVIVSSVLYCDCWTGAQWNVTTPHLSVWCPKLVP